MIPIKDNIPRHRFPFINYALIAINIYVFAYEFIMPKSQFHEFMGLYGMTPELVLVALGKFDLAGAILPFFTSMFLHAGLIHIGFNMLFLHIFGDNMEDRFGHILFLLFYLVAGLAGGIAHFVFSLVTHVSLGIPTVGASGAIAGVLGAYMISYPRARVTTLVFIILPTFIDVPAVLFLGFWFILQFLSGAMDSMVSQGGGGVAYWAHIGGFIWGAAFAVFYKFKINRAR
jgi:rhomboid family protein